MLGQQEGGEKQRLVCGILRLVQIRCELPSSKKTAPLKSIENLTFWKIRENDDEQRRTPPSVSPREDAHFRDVPGFQKNFLPVLIKANAVPEMLGLSQLIDHIHPKTIRMRETEVGT